MSEAPLNGAEAARTGWSVRACPKFDNIVCKALWIKQYNAEIEKMYQEHLRGCEQAGKEHGQ